MCQAYEGEAAHMRSMERFQQIMAYRAHGIDDRQGGAPADGWTARFNPRDDNHRKRMRADRFGGP